MSEEIATPLNVAIDVAQEQKKPRLVSLLFFDFKNETRENKLNLIGVFDQIFVDPKEKRTRPFGVFVRTGQTFEKPIQMTIFDPEGKPQGGFLFDPTGQELPDPKPFQAQILGFIAFNTPMEGFYWFDVSYNQESLGGAGMLVAFRDSKENENDNTRGDA